MDRTDLSCDGPDLRTHELRIVQLAGGCGADPVICGPDLHRTDGYSV